ncbi:cytochrome c [Roseiarcus fermentans]|uniref:Cytochrome c n=1 Tax=Roseiarcus fermentans TaxID=1473586 RepID=A0A366FGR4_9HYPH|nr:c-type cytochrome [Roseiarcus fermentans]RBP12909.1 cytochrome c [Roseiarcus fermentans]
MSRRTVVSGVALVLAVAAPDMAIADQGRLDPNTLPVPPGGTREQVLLGDKIFHGEAAEGKCAQCHGADAKGTANGNDLTLGMWIWGDGSVTAIKTTIGHNMKMAPGMDGRLAPGDVDAVVAYVWALGHQKPQAP